MGKKCSVPGCKSGYASAKPGISKISFFSFPSDPDLKEKWKIGIQRPGWEPFPNSTVCSLHFIESDIQTNSTDSQTRRKRSRPSEKLQRLKLFPDAIPSIFSNTHSSIVNQVTVNEEKVLHFIWFLDF